MMGIWKVVQKVWNVWKVENDNNNNKDNNEMVFAQNFYPILTSTQKFIHHNRSLLPNVEVLLSDMVKTSRCSTKLLFMTLNFYS